MAKKTPKTTNIHGETLLDNYFWLREKKNPEVMAYLEAENAYTDAVMKPTEGTILTVARIAGEHAVAASDGGADLLEFGREGIAVEEAQPPERPADRERALELQRLGRRPHSRHLARDAGEAGATRSSNPRHA